MTSNLTKFERALKRNSIDLKPVRLHKHFIKRVIPFLIIALSFPVQGFALSEDDRHLLEKIEKDSLNYFTKLSHKETGLTKDSSRQGSPASIAATGFALASLAIGASRGWLPDDYVQKRLRKSLKFLLKTAEHERGFYYHFLDQASGKRVWASEASSIDTALLIAGAFVAAQYYPGTEIEKLAHQIYERVDWAWMMNGSDLICMGWKPESGFLPYYWDSYNELIILQALAIGSPTHPIEPDAWQAWFRNQDDFNGKTIIYSHSGSLFTYQFSHAFIDFRELDDRGVNYFKNSEMATIANREYSLASRHIHKGYTENSWGLSASVGPGGYKAYGGKPGEGLHDGTIAPYAAISSIVFTPELSMNAVRHFYDEHQENLYGIFGFKDSFNIDKKWWANEYLGIDQGITILMLENYLQDGIIWKKFEKLDLIQKWIELAELKTQGGNLSHP